MKAGTEINLSASLLRLSVLLFVASFVGVLGLNGSINPARIQTAKAAALDIVLLSDGESSLQFQLNVLEGCPDVLAPGDACFANVEVRNGGDETAEISPPTASVTGILNTCTGPDVNNPGIGGPNLSVGFQNATYSAPVTLLSPGDSESFEVAFELDVGIENACQGKSATIIISILTGLPTGPVDNGPPGSNPPPGSSSPDSSPPDSSPPEAPNPPSPPPPVISEPPGLSLETNFGDEVAGSRSEVLPSRFPVTGTGWTADEQPAMLGFFFWGLGALAIVCGIFALVVHRRTSH